MREAYTPPANGTDSGLAIRNLRVAYGKHVVLDNLSLPPIKPGSIVGVLGPNGAGKSTFLRALARMLPAQGEAQWHGIHLLECARSTHLKTISYLPQTLPQPSSLLVYEAMESALRSVKRSIDPLELEQRMSAIVDQLQIRELAMRPLQQLSGGQRQMVGLAQVLIRNTPLLLLDEPTSALDLRWQLLALDSIRHRAQQAGTIALVALHDLNLANRFCDQLVLLAPQGLIAAGTPAEVMLPRFLLEAYQVHAKVEKTQQGQTVVLIESISGSGDTRAPDELPIGTNTALFEGEPFQSN